MSIHNPSSIAASLLDELTKGCPRHELPLPATTDVTADIEHIYRLYQLQKIIRFYGQTYWSAETSESNAAKSGLSLENVAAHSFHVASAAQILAPYFSGIDRLRVIELALIHDEAEILTGDQDPIGKDGKGLQTHAFNAHRRLEKEQAERAAAASLTSRLRPSFQKHYQTLAMEALEGKTTESRFIKSVDKLQALIFVRLKKRGSISADHLAFTIRYSRIGIKYFPMLQAHFLAVMSDILADIEGDLGSRVDEFCGDVVRILDAGVSS